MYTQPGIISSSVSSSPFFSTLSTSLVICNLYTDCTAWLRPFLSSPALRTTVCMCGGGDLKSSATQVFHASVLFTCLSSWPASFLASNLAYSLLTFITQLKETTVCNLWCPARSSFKQVPAEPTNRKQNKVLYCSTLSQSAITMLKTLPHPWRKKGKKCILKRANSETSEHGSVAWKCLWAGHRDMHNPAIAHLVSLCRAQLSTQNWTSASWQFNKLCWKIRHVTHWTVQLRARYIRWKGICRQNCVWHLQRCGKKSLSTAPSGKL